MKQKFVRRNTEHFKKWLCYLFSVAAQRRNSQECAAGDEVFNVEGAFHAGGYTKPLTTDRSMSVTRGVLA